MAALTIPLSCWVSLFDAVTGNEVTRSTYGGYARVPATLVYCADGVSFANPVAIQWNQALRSWGTISAVMLFDAETGGNELSTPLPTAGLVTIPQYSRPRIPPAGILGTFGSQPRPFGVGPYGTDRYGTWQRVVATAGVPLLLTFAPEHVCGAGAWQPAEDCGAGVWAPPAFVPGSGTWAPGPFRGVA